MIVKRLEDYLRKKILSELTRGRLGYDLSHTKAVVKKIKEILENNPDLKLDRMVLIIAAYAHDWGYVGMFDNSRLAQIQEVIEAKADHMENGAKKLRGLLEDDFFNFLTKAQKERAIHLVRVHDSLKDLKAPDELVLMEADVLGSADLSLVKPTYNRQSNKEWVKQIREKKLPRFMTDFSKKELERLMKQRERYYKEND